MQKVETPPYLFYKTSYVVTHPTACLFFYKSHFLTAFFSMFYFANNSSSSPETKNKQNKFIKEVILLSLNFKITFLWVTRLFRIYVLIFATFNSTSHIRNRPPLIWFTPTYFWKNRVVLPLLCFLKNLNPFINKERGLGL